MRVRDRHLVSLTLSRRTFMPFNRRTFLVTSAAAAGTVTILPYGALADGHSANVFKTETG
ncbi:MAG: twin-arginine translocation signal domain-containing protein, partial [Pseudomonadota bacterium]